MRKPLIVIGLSLDQVNGAAAIAYRNLGIAITRISEVTFDNLEKSIKQLLSNEEVYKRNCLQAQKFVQAVDGKATFYYWLNYISENGYEHLLIPSYSEYNYIELYNLDIALCWIIICFVFFKLLIWKCRTTLKSFLVNKK